MSLVVWPHERRGPTAGDSGPSQRPGRAPPIELSGGDSDQRQSNIRGSARRPVTAAITAGADIGIIGPK